MPNWIGEIPYKKVTVVSGTWKELTGGSANRRYLAWRISTTTSMFIKASNVDPTPDTTGDTSDLFEPSEKFYWDAAAMTTSRIWAFQASGGDADVFIADVEG